MAIPFTSLIATGKVERNTANGRCPAVLIAECVIPTARPPILVADHDTHLAKSEQKNVQRDWKHRPQDHSPAQKRSAEEATAQSRALSPAGQATASPASSRHHCPRLFPRHLRRFRVRFVSASDKYSRALEPFTVPTPVYHQKYETDLC